MTPELITTIIVAVLGGGITGFVGAYIALSKLPAEKRKLSADIGAVNIDTAIRLMNELQEERAVSAADREAVAKEFRELRHEIDCLHEGQRQRDEMIAELKASIQQLEAENVQLRHELNETHLELEAWRRGQRRRGE
jgi:predicted  nucleic acid-binding Zn-ribbon protein